MRKQKKFNEFKIHFKEGSASGSPLVTNSMSVLLLCFEKNNDIIEKIEINGKIYDKFPKSGWVKFLLGKIEK